MDRIVFILAMIAVAVIALTVIPPLYYSTLPNLSCTSGPGGSTTYDTTRIARSLEQPLDVIFVVGTIEHVETRAVDQYEPIHRPVDRGNYTDLEVVGYEPTGDKIPWKLITMNVEKYVLDETGNYSEEITFRTPANVCFDNKSQELVPLPKEEGTLYPTSLVEFNVGDRSFIEIYRLGDGSLQTSSNFKLDIDDNDVIDMDPKRILVPSRGGDRPLTLAEVESHVMAEAAKIQGSP